MFFLVNPFKRGRNYKFVPYEMATLGALADSINASEGF